jgi:hypothetical protein
MFEKFVHPCWLSCCNFKGRCFDVFKCECIFFSKYIVVTVGSRSERFEVGSLNKKIAVGIDSSDTYTFLLQTKEQRQ